MAIEYKAGYTYTNGETQTINKANLAQTARTIECATNKLLGRATAGTGAIEEIDCTAAARALLDDTSTAEMLTTLGIGIGDVSSDWNAARGIYKAGTSGSGVTEVLFDTTNAPSVALTAGNWFVSGSLYCSLGVTQGRAITARFRNVTDGQDFGGGAFVIPQSSGTFGCIPVTGYISVASGTKTVQFRAIFITFASGESYEIGSSDSAKSSVPAGFIQAFKVSGA